MPSLAPSPSAGGPLTTVPRLSGALPKLTPRKTSKQLEPPAKPRPATPTLASPSDQTKTHFVKPCRRILSPKDHELFKTSPTYDLVVAFIFRVSESVEDLTISEVQTRQRAPAVETILSILEEAESILAEFPPGDNAGSRFGNKVFRDYLDALDSRYTTWSDRLGVPKEAQEEVTTYLKQSFGNWSRIDYGSGHELNFFIWLLCLNRLSLLPEPTFPMLALLVFPRYLKLMRNIQTTYYLEPAGSHGVWGLDDYQFLPFLFGASQLLHHPHLRPMSIHQNMILEQCSKDYLYLDQVAFVNSVKNVEGLRWHSPMLDDISSAKNWIKVEAGMRRMFLADVLGKLPVMQHFLFGSLVPAAEGMSQESDESADSCCSGEAVMTDGMKHEHAATGWGDCCGIPVPSSVGAMQELKRSGASQGLRRVPFD